jgi:hypothetical protein
MSDKKKCSSIVFDTSKVTVKQLREPSVMCSVIDEIKQLKGPSDDYAVVKRPAVEWFAKDVNNNQRNELIVQPLFLIRSFILIYPI